MKRDFISEICERRDRKPQDGDTIWEFMDRLGDAREIAILLKAKDYKCETALEREFLRVLPVIVIAALEGYLSSIYGLIVDKGEPYLGNISSIKDMKLDVNALVSMQKKDVSIGEVVAHVLSFNNLPEIDKNFSKLLGINFIGSLSTKAQDVKPDVIKCINIRNILAHELATQYPVNYRLHMGYFRSVVVFAFEVENLIYRTVGFLKHHGREYRSLKS